MDFDQGVLRMTTRSTATPKIVSDIEVALGKQLVVPLVRAAKLPFRPSSGVTTPMMTEPASAPASCVSTPVSKHVVAVEEDLGTASRDVEPSSSASVRTKGRPPTSRQFVDWAASKQRLVQAERDAYLWQKEKEFLESGTLPSKAPSRIKKDKRFMERMIEELRQHPSADLRAQIYEHMEKVEGTIQISSNMKGTCQKSLRDAALSVKAIMNVLTERDNDDGMEENVALRREICALKAEIAALKVTIAELQGAVGVVDPKPGLAVPSSVLEPTSPAPRSRARTRRQSKVRRRIISSPPSSSDRDCTALPDRDRSPTALRVMEDRLFERLVVMFRHQFRDVLPQVSAVAPSTTDHSVDLHPPLSPRRSMTPRRPNVRTTARSSRPSTLPDVSQQQEDTWAQVVRKSKKKKPVVVSPTKPAQQDTYVTSPVKSRRPAKSASATALQPKRKKAIPRVAAVSITALDGNYNEPLLKARQATNPEQHGIKGMKAKRSLTGGYVFEIPGSEGDAKADAFAASLREVFKDSDTVRIARPMRKMELRLRRLVESIASQDVVSAITTTYGCSSSDVDTGVLRRAPHGLYDLWVRVPTVVGTKMLADSTLQVGWTLASVVQLEPRKLQCFRCLEFGHVKLNCKNTDHSDLCYRCGTTGHLARLCTALPCCFMCKTRGLPTGHRMGGQACPLPIRGDGRTSGARRGPGAASSGQVPAGQPIASQPLREHVATPRRSNIARTISPSRGVTTTGGRRGPGATHGGQVPSGQPESSILTIGEDVFESGTRLRSVQSCGDVRVGSVSLSPEVTLTPVKKRKIGHSSENLDWARDGEGVPFALEAMDVEVPAPQPQRIKAKQALRTQVQTKVHQRWSTLLEEDGSG
ncbi:hypothetical protein DMN91_013071 [Ooceraea biroi]|uniref:CCHC-type domain-containing protein n=1 Tax=Ooceraea biroi TaxID=2015173 RepID=A0A3L8D346_OOCBI|nr:hypothetical protein DMN91_013071 [Ooceraea biroi]